ncbi:MAG: hypothetical protein M1812_000518 [Candelaria pacifica]|nr:MAG: hypothetical protein M1812_000518 [Candelaria pacifica]
MSGSDVPTAGAGAELLYSYFAGLTLQGSNTSAPARNPEYRYSATPPGSRHGSSTLHSNHGTAQAWYSPSPAGDCSSCGTPVPPPTITSLYLGAPVQICQGCGNSLSRSNGGSSPEHGSSSISPTSPPVKDFPCPYQAGSSTEPAEDSLLITDNVNNHFRTRDVSQDRRRRKAVDIGRVTRGKTRISKGRSSNSNPRSQKSWSSSGKSAHSGYNKILRNYHQTVVGALQRSEQTLDQCDIANTAASNGICSCHLFDCDNIKHDPTDSYRGPLPASKRSQMSLVAYYAACDLCFATLMSAHDQDILSLSQRLWEWSVYGDMVCLKSDSEGSNCDCNPCVGKRTLTELLHTAVERKRFEAQILRPRLEDPSGSGGLFVNLDELLTGIGRLTISNAESPEVHDSYSDQPEDLNIDEGVWDL